MQCKVSLFLSRNLCLALHRNCNNHDRYGCVTVLAHNTTPIRVLCDSRLLAAAAEDGEGVDAFCTAGERTPKDLSAGSDGSARARDCRGPTEIHTTHFHTPFYTAPHLYPIFSLQWFFFFISVAPFFLAGFFWSLPFVFRRLGSDTLSLFYRIGFSRVGRGLSSFFPVIFPVVSLDFSIFFRTISLPPQFVPKTTTLFCTQSHLSSFFYENTKPFPFHNSPV